uniref:Aminotransferase-like plant mobile domain-containing protein n=1 Tax=Gossypium hirsutum TaxID=3635 RepID=I3NMW6_GOSHI|nr:hypothetical protein [Gossypium hirsutum]
MVAFLIRFDDKHIFATQVVMGAAKLDLALINTLVERWKPKHTFHLLCGEYTITLEDVALQLDLPVDGLVVIKGSTIILGKVDLCTTLLGKVTDKFEGVWISTNWLEDNFDELFEDRTEEEGTWLHDRFVIRSDKRCAAYGYAISGYIFRGTDVPHILQPYTDVDVESHVRIDVNICTTTNNDIGSNAHATVDDDVDAWYLFDVPKIWGILWLHAYEMITKWAVQGTYSGDDDDDEKVYKPASPDTPPNAPPIAPLVEPPIVCINPPCNHRLPPYGTHSPQ